MIRRSLARLSSAAEGFLDATPSTAEVQQAALKLYRELSGMPPKSLPAAVRVDLALATEKLALLKWIEASLEKRDADSPPRDRLAHVRKWRLELPPAGVLVAGKFAAGAGAFLDVLDAHGDEEERTFAVAQTERLMRHVEVKREHSLAESFPDIAPDQIAMEPQDVAILFARTAVRRSDLRFLNTAFKMNDWRLARPGRSRRGLKLPQRARFLLSLAEQEVAASVLL